MGVRACRREKCFDPIPPILPFLPTPILPSSHTLCYDWSSFQHVVNKALDFLSIAIKGEIQCEQIR